MQIPNMYFIPFDPQLHCCPTPHSLGYLVTPCNLCSSDFVRKHICKDSYEFSWKRNRGCMSWRMCYVSPHDRSMVIACHCCEWQIVDTCTFPARTVGALFLRRNSFPTISTKHEFIGGRRRWSNFLWLLTSAEDAWTRETKPSHRNLGSNRPQQQQQRDATTEHTDAGYDGSTGAEQRRKISSISARYEEKQRKRYLVIWHTEMSSLRLEIVFCALTYAE